MRTIRDQEESIKSLREHVARLEQINFHNEVSAVNLTNVSHSLINANMSIDRIVPDNDKSDIKWKQRVQGLETQLCEMREFYDQKIQALEQAQSLEQ